jgi:hypothetical protein
MNEADGIIFFDTKLPGLARAVCRKPPVFSDQILGRERVSFRGGYSPRDAQTFREAVSLALSTLRVAMGYRGRSQGLCSFD